MATTAKKQIPSEIVEEIRNSLVIKTAKCLLCENESNCYADQHEYIFEALDDVLFHIQMVLKILNVLGADCSDFKSCQ